MSITINTKSFTIQTQGSDSSEYVYDASTLATPYRMKFSRALPKVGIKNSVLRGGGKISKVFLDANGDPQVAVINVTSSIPASCPAAIIAELEADFEASVAHAVFGDALFRGKVVPL